jgi:hypothetical protein
MPTNDKIALNRITYVEEIELDGIKYVRKQEPKIYDAIRSQNTSPYFF